MEYLIKKYKKSKHIRITLKMDGSVLVTIPYYLSYKDAERFVLEKKDWIEKNLPKRNTSNKYTEYKDQAYQLVQERLAHFNKVYNYKYNKVTIKNQKTMWGSCSRKGNLNFSYRLALLPKEMCDYIVVHELCHLQEFNHSKNFWKLVEKTIPNYKEIKKQLKKHSV